MRKKLNKKLTLRIETLRHLGHLGYVHGGSAAATCADTCSDPLPEPSVNGCNTFIPSAFGCGSGFPGCQYYEMTKGC